MPDYTISQHYSNTDGSPLASIFVNEKNYVFYFTPSNTISYLRGKDGKAYGAYTVEVNNEVQVEIKANTALLAATAYQDSNGKPTSIRVYFTDTSQLIRELIGDIPAGDDDDIAWKYGGLTDKKYKVAAGSGLTANSGKNGTLRVFFIADTSADKITEAYYHNDQNKWNDKVLK